MPLFRFLFFLPSLPLSSWTGCSGLPAGPCVHLTRERKTQPDTAREHSGLQHSPFRLASQQWFQPGRDSREKLRDKSWNTTRWTTRYSTNGKGEKRNRREALNEDNRTCSLPYLHLICTVRASKNDLNSDPLQSTDFQTPLREWILCMSHTQQRNNLTWLRTKTTGSDSAGLLLTSEMGDLLRQTPSMWDTGLPSVWRFTNIYLAVVCLRWFVWNRTMVWHLYVCIYSSNKQLLRVYGL